MKITFLQLNGYRGFASCALRNLGGMNLLVGKSNSGRVSMLGTMSLLTENGGLPALTRFATQRRHKDFLNY